jgi:hypothetical protein
VLLIPEVVDPGLKLPDDVLQIYQRVWWTSAPHGDDLQLTAERQWVSSQGGSVEVGVVGKAFVHGRQVAENLAVSRYRGDGVTWGVRDVPSLPEVGITEPTHTLTIDEREVQSFVALVHADYRVHDDMRHVRQRGFANLLVPGVILLVAELRKVYPRDVATVEMWFRLPVPAGSHVRSSRSLADPTLHELRILGHDAAAAVMRVQRGDIRGR